jgi:hypothetical protein
LPRSAFWTSSSAASVFFYSGEFFGIAANALKSS